MQNSRRKPLELRLMPLILLTCMAWDVSLASANDTIEQCAAAASKDARIQCLEEALLTLSGESDRRMQDATAERKSSPGSLVAGEASPPPNAAAAVAPGMEETPMPAATESEEPPTPTEPPVVKMDSSPVLQVSNATEVSDASSTAPVSHDDELGAEQVALLRGEKQEVPRVTAMVIEHSEVGYQKVRVRLDNGQVWQQTDGDRVRVIRKLRNDPTFAVELWQTSSGGYRMRIPSKNIILRVRRLQ
jgi:hypothetical protein